MTRNETIEEGLMRCLEAAIVGRGCLGCTIYMQTDTYIHKGTYISVIYRELLIHGSCFPRGRLFTKQKC